MRLSGFLFALFVGFALPALLIGAGMELPTARLAALLVFGTAIGGLIPAGLDLLTHHMREEEASQIRQRDANSEMTRAHAAEVWAKVNPAPAPLVDDQAHLEQLWRPALHRIVTAGNLYGFKIRDLAAGDHKVVEWEDWSPFRELLIDIGVLEARGGTRWAEGWDYARWQKEWGTIPLPLLEGVPPPVALTVNTAQKQQKQQAIAG